MQGKTHIAGGILAGELLLAVHGQTTPVLAGELLTAAAAGALFPDIDHGESKISNTNFVTKILANLFELILKHRGPIHTPVTGALLTVFVWFSLSAAAVAPGTVYALTAGFAVGFASHLILDSFNPGGIMWLWPFRKKRYHLARIKNRTAKETILFIFLIALDLIAESVFHIIVI
ncbi:MAG: metal-dependent hydrolase [Eubacteriales bacterium]|nr:metal-dependent hydrolase [Eubacteriales bacterium]